MISSLSLTQLADDYVPAAAFEGIEKLVLKDPLPYKVHQKAVHRLTHAIKEHAPRLFIRKLVLCKMNLGTSGLMHIAESLQQNTSLEQLDVSNNQLNASSFIQFFERIWSHNKIKVLNISYNNCRSFTHEEVPVEEGEALTTPRPGRKGPATPTFESAFCKFVHTS